MSANLLELQEMLRKISMPEVQQVASGQSGKAAQLLAMDEIKRRGEIMSEAKGEQAESEMQQPPMIDQYLAISRQMVGDPPPAPPGMGGPPSLPPQGLGSMVPPQAPPRQPPMGMQGGAPMPPAGGMSPMPMQQEAPVQGFQSGGYVHPFRRGMESRSVSNAPIGGRFATQREAANRGAAHDRAVAEEAERLMEIALANSPGLPSRAEAQKLRAESARQAEQNVKAISAGSAVPPANLVNDGVFENLPSYAIQKPFMGFMDELQGPGIVAAPVTDDYEKWLGEQPIGKWEDRPPQEEPGSALDKFNETLGKEPEGIYDFLMRSGLAYASGENVGTAATQGLDFSLSQDLQRRELERQDRLDALQERKIISESDYYDAMAGKNLLTWEDATEMALEILESEMSLNMELRGPEREAWLERKAMELMQRSGLMGGMGGGVRQGIAGVAGVNPVRGLSVLNPYSGTID